MADLTTGLGLCSEPALMILMSLAEGALDGPAITGRIDALGGVAPSRGALYGSLARLEAQGLIECLPSRSRQHPYALTERGRSALERWLGSLHAFAVGGLDRLAGLGVGATIEIRATIDLREPGPVDQRV